MTIGMKGIKIWCEKERKKRLRCPLLRRLDVLNRKIIDLHLRTLVVTQLGLLQVFNEELCMRAKSLVISPTEIVKDIKSLYPQVDAHGVVMPTFVHRVIGSEFLVHGKHHLHIFRKEKKK